MKKHVILAALLAMVATPAASQDMKVDPLHVDVLMKFAFSQAPKDWAGRVEQERVATANRGHGHSRRRPGPGHLGLSLRAAGRGSNPD